MALPPGPAAAGRLNLFGVRCAFWAGSMPAVFPEPDFVMVDRSAEVRMSPTRIFPAVFRRFHPASHWRRPVQECHRIHWRDPAPDRPWAAPPKAEDGQDSAVGRCTPKLPG